MTTREFLLEYGVPIKKVNKILSRLGRNCSTSSTNPQDAVRSVKGLEKMGFTRSEVILLILNTPSILDIDDKVLIKKSEFFKKYCSDWNALKKSLLKCPNLFSLSIDNVLDKEQSLQDLGFRDDDIKRIFKKLPEIFTLSKENILEKVMWAKKMRLMSADDRRFFTNFPAAFGLSISKMEKNLDCLYEKGFTVDETITIVRGNPGILGYKVESLGAKLDFILNEGFRKTLLRTPMILIQSISLSKARIELLKSRGIEIDGTLIYKGSHEFNNRFHITQEALLAYAPKEII